MITVSILINGKPIFTRSAINNGNINSKGETKYITDGNDPIRHKREDGAVKLAKKMLDTINEDMKL